MDRNQHRPSAKDGCCFTYFILIVVIRYLAKWGKELAWLMVTGDLLVGNVE